MAGVLRHGCLVTLLIAASLGSVHAADAVKVAVDQAAIIQLPERVSTIVIGNPLIADATLQAGGMLVVTGKGYGSTNLVALDRGGRTLLSRDVQVTGPRNGDLVTVYKGVERESYSCTPNCERRITLGDSPTFFNATLGQTGQRNGLAAAPAPGR